MPRCPVCQSPSVRLWQAFQKPIGTRLVTFYCYACESCPRTPTTGSEGQRLIVPPLWIERKDRP
mgnify:CR=1 FL=1